MDEIKQKKREQFFTDFKKSKYDLETIIDHILHKKQLFYIKGETEEEKSKFHIKKKHEIINDFGEKEIKIECENPYLDIITIIYSSVPSLIAPFYHYNRYVDKMIIDCNWESIKYTIDSKKKRFQYIKKM